MNVELDWQIVDENVPEPGTMPSPPKPRRHLSRRAVLALVLIPLIGMVAIATYVAWTWRTQLDRASRQVRLVARSEAQAVASGDRQTFLALQDPDDPAWRAMQAKRFGRLEQEGLPEFGWKTMGIAPQPGDVSLEPGGARLDVIYRFWVTQPVPERPSSVTLRMPQFYKQTPSGWVHANPGPDYWGGWHTRSGRYLAMLYLQRDAGLLEPLLPQMDEMLARVCGPLRCPPQPVLVVFENSASSLANLSEFVHGFDDGAFTLRLPSPQLTGMPADERSRDEYDRAIGTRVVEALITEASDHRFGTDSIPSQQLLRWELAKAGLTGPFITSAMTRTLGNLLQAGQWQPLATLALRSRPAGIEATVDEVAMPSLAFAFLEEHLGTGTVERLIPALQANVTLGDAVSAIWKVNPTSLEPAWMAYLRKQAGLPTGHLATPVGELALLCMSDPVTSSVWLVRADGTGATQVAQGQHIAQPAWSYDGKRLAYLQEGHAFVMEADSLQIRAVREGYVYRAVGWLPDPQGVGPGRLRLDFRDVQRGLIGHIVNLDTGEDVEINGMQHIWSPDGMRMAYYASDMPTPSIWIADANGRNAQQIAAGYGPAWSPDSRRLAFFGTSGLSRVFQAGQVEIADAASGSVTTLARVRDLIQSSAGGSDQIGWVSNLAWSPDGSMLAMAFNQTTGPTLLVLNAGTGAVRARWQGTSARWVSSTWSSDNRHVAFLMTPASGRSVGTVGVLDVATSRAVILSGSDFDWSPDGNWLAVTQDKGGVLLVAPDLPSMRWLDTPNCLSVAWQPTR